MADVERKPQPAGKSVYVKPVLERLGTIRDLTSGPGMQGDNDNDHPPGQNKSRI